MFDGLDKRRAIRWARLAGSSTLSRGVIMRWSFLMCAAGIAFGLAACGGGETTTGDTSSAGSAGTGGTGGAGGAKCVVDGKVADSEQCDDGNMTDGDGCDNDCTFSCADPAADCPAPSECTLAACSATHTCDTAPDPAQDGKACATGVCKNGACSGPMCGDGFLDADEDCDFGA